MNPRAKVTMTLRAWVAVLAIGMGLWAHAGTVAFWQFQPDNLLADSSGNGHTLSNVVGAITATNDIPDRPGLGLTGSAVFNGSSYVQTVSNLNLSGYTNITIEWFMKDASASLQQLFFHAPDFSKTFWDDANVYAIGGALNDAYAFEGMHRVLIAGGVASAVIRGSARPTSGWHHYAIIYDALAADPTNHIRLYIDGAAVATTTYSPAPTNAASAFANALFRIGASGAGTIPIGGQIADMRMSDRILSTNEFLMSQPLPETIAFWQFQPGNLLADSSGNNYPLTNAAGAVTATNDPPIRMPLAGSAVFDGASYCQTMRNLNLSYYTNLTVEWFMKDANTSGQAVFWHGPDVSKGIWDADNKYELSAIIHDTYPFEALHRIDRAEAGGAWPYYILRGSARPTNGWHHYAITVDALAAAPTNHLRFYFDRAEVAASTYVNSATNCVSTFTTGIFIIGAVSAGGAPLSGNIADMRISGRILSPAEFLAPSRGAILSFR